MSVATIFYELLRIGKFIWDSFMHIWWLLLITIPLAVWVNISDTGKYVKKLTNYNVFLSIFFGTVIGAFSPFCSCSVIPVITSFLIAGVPLAAVMSFWIASPSMDPEIFFLSVASLGWPLAFARLVATFFLSLGGGLITHFFVSKGWIGKDYLKLNREPQHTIFSLRNLRGKMETILNKFFNVKKQQVSDSKNACCEEAIPNIGAVNEEMNLLEINFAAKPQKDFSQQEKAKTSCCSEVNMSPSITNLASVQKQETNCCSISKVQEAESSCCNNILSEKNNKEFTWGAFWKELMDVLWMVGKYLFIAYFLEAVISFYVPKEWIQNLLGVRNPFSVLYATILGVPLYTTNLTALGLIGGLLAKNMSGGAALAFLISGATTTLPAMSAVYGIVSKRVFLLYLGIIAVGAIFFGYTYQIIEMILLKT